MMKNASLNPPPPRRPAPPVGARTLAGRLRGSPLTLLCGPPGDARSNAVRDGVMPLLQRRASDSPIAFDTGGAVVLPFPDRRGSAQAASGPAAGRAGIEVAVLLDNWLGLPVDELHTQIGRLLCIAPLRVAAAGPTLATRLQALAERFDVRFLIVCDRFEDALRAAEADGGCRVFVDELSAVIRAARPAAHVLLSVGDDATALLNGFRQRFPALDSEPLRLSVDTDDNRPAGPATAEALSKPPPASEPQRPPIRLVTPSAGAPRAATEAPAAADAGRPAPTPSTPSTTTPATPSADRDWTSSIESILARIASTAAQPAEPAAAADPKPAFAPTQPFVTDARSELDAAAAEVDVPLEFDAPPVAATTPPGAATGERRTPAPADVDGTPPGGLAADAAMPKPPERPAPPAQPGRVPKPAQASQPAAQPAPPAAAAMPAPASAVTPPAAPLESRASLPANEPGPTGGAAPRAADTDEPPQRAPAVETPAGAPAAMPTAPMRAASMPAASMPTASMPTASIPATPMPAPAVPMPVPAAPDAVDLPPIAAAGVETPPAPPAPDDDAGAWHTEHPAAPMPAVDNHRAARQAWAATAVVLASAAVWWLWPAADRPDGSPPVAALTPARPALPPAVSPAVPSPATRSAATVPRVTAPQAAITATTGAPAAVAALPSLGLAVDGDDGGAARLATDLVRWVGVPAGVGLQVEPAAGWADALAAPRDGQRLAVARYDALAAMKRESPGAAVRLVTPLVSEELYFIARADSPLVHVHDIERATRINIGPAQGGRAVTAQTVYQRLFDHPMLAGQASFANRDAALHELLAARSVDVIVVVDPQPSAWLARLPAAELAAIKLLPLAPDHPTTLRARRTYLPALLQAGTAPVLRETPTLSVMSFLVATGHPPTTTSGAASAAGVEANARTTGLIASLSTSLCRQLDPLRRNGHPKWQELQPGLQLPAGWPYAGEAVAAFRRCATVASATPTRAPAEGPARAAVDVPAPPAAAVRRPVSSDTKSNTNPHRGAST